MMGHCKYGNDYSCLHNLRVFLDQGDLSPFEEEPCCMDPLS